MHKINIRQTLKKCLIGFVVVSSIFTNTACGDITIESGFRDRLEEVNTNLLKLRNINMLTESEYKSYKKRYDDIADKISTVIGSDNVSEARDIIKSLKTYISRVYRLDTTSSEGVKYGEDSFDSSEVNDYDTVCGQVRKELKISDTEYTGKVELTGTDSYSESYRIPIEYKDIDVKRGLGDSNDTNVNSKKEVKFKEYQIKEGVNLSQYIEALANYKKTGNIDSLTKNMIWQDTGESNIVVGELFITTSRNSWVNNGYGGVNNNNYNYDYTVCQTVTMYRNFIDKNNKTVTAQVSISMPLFDVRIYEPDSSVISRLQNGIESSGLYSSVQNESKYLYKMGEGAVDNYIFKIEYSVERLDTLERSGNDVKFGYEDIENISYNLGSNCFMYENGEVRKKIEQNSLSIFITGNTDGLDKYASDKYTEEMTNSKISTLGSESLKAEGTGKDTKLLLTDYFETIYMGDEVGAGNWIVTGRRLRLNNDKTSGTDIFAYVDYGNKIMATETGEPKTVSYKSILSKDSILAGITIGILKDGSNNTLGGLEGQLSFSGRSNIYYNKYITEMTDDERKDNVKTLDKIEVTTNITEPHIGGSAKDIGTLPIYGIKLLADAKSESLNTSWIMTDNKYNNMASWLKWLDMNNIKYSYDLKDIKDKSGYTYEFGQLVSGYNAALDKVKIDEIQARIDEKSKSEFNSIIRSVIVVVGYGIMLWGIVLIPAWIIDTNIYLGVEFYRILTFGTCRAVSLNEEKEKSKYRQVGIKELILTVLLAMALGISLIYVDYMKIIAYIVLVFSKIAVGLENVIMNMR